jgi:hypothetical protein
VIIEIHRIFKDCEQHFTLGGTVWLTSKLVAGLFEMGKTFISKNITKLDKNG